MMGLSVIGIINQVFWAVEMLVIMSVVLSWLVLFRVVSPASSFVRFVFNLTEPLFAPFRRLLPPTVTGGLDISPIFLLIALQIAHQLIVQVLR